MDEKFCIQCHTKQPFTLVDTPTGKAYLHCLGEGCYADCPNSLHIGQIPANEKTAMNLEYANLDNDWYHNNIIDSATILTNLGYDLYIYGGQFASGNTWWTSPNNKKTLRVDLEAEVAIF